ncbi:conserved hypothetical protein [Kribbella flavida DSM 17836]|uniref:Catalase n=1 Tax=Kribbella flavida (strain DSM 17836 / JCM 10339 / NBRC 14399) TaxID=479435 RepID=D2PYC7_KRIFD|nr:conserved hypothetical protein [Kribbella flavida DSM 17836]
MGSTVIEPSVEWREVVHDDEAERHRRQAERFVELQARRSGEFGAGRASHRQQVAALRAVLTVPSDLPEYAQQGLFRVPDTYDAWVRLSNGGFNRAPDAVPDVHGFAVKVFGTSGPAALGGEAVCQDLVLINHERLSSPTSEEFTTLVTTAAGTSGQVLRAVARQPSLFPRLRAASAALKTPFSGFATQDFFSAAPIAFGPYAVRVKLAARADQVDPRASGDWAADVHARLADGPLHYDLQVQFFVDEQRTPIEDASVVWDTPCLTVARLTVPRQRPDPALADEIERASFDPWTAKAEHRPLGEVMRARRIAYAASRQNRDAQ